MKKTNLLVLSVAAALLATSCSKDQVSEVNPGEAIRFSALTGSATKAAEVTSANLAEYKVYGVYATSTSLNFTDTYTKGGQNGSTWTNTGGTHYWPTDKAENVTFFAHSPADLATALGVSNIGSPTTDSWRISNVSIPLDAKSQKDVVYARYRTNQETAAGAAVPIVLKHIFTQIELKALCSDDSVRVTVYGAKIYGMKDGAALSFPTSNTQTGREPSAIWDAVSNVQTYTVGGSLTDSVILAKAATSIMGTDGNFMLIPQNLTTAWDPEGDKQNTNNGGYIGILCKMEKRKADGSYQQLHPTSGSAPAYTAVPLSYNFQKNKKYSITLKFFTNGGGGGVTDPDDPTNPGQPILAPITFDVSVTDWETPSDSAIDKPLS